MLTGDPPLDALYRTVNTLTTARAFLRSDLHVVARASSDAAAAKLQREVCSQNTYLDSGPGMGDGPP